MLMPKKVKYRKQQRGRRSGKAWRGGHLAFGEYGLKALEAAWITDRQIEASRVAITRFIKRGGKLWVRIFPEKPFTKKPAETRMGKGKGAPPRARRRPLPLCRRPRRRPLCSRPRHRPLRSRQRRRLRNDSGDTKYGAGAAGADRQGDQRQDAKDDCGRSDAARAAYEVPPRGAHLEKILRARRTARSAPGRHRTHHRLSAAFAAQALAARGSADAQGGRRVSEGRGADR